MVYKVMFASMLLTLIVCLIRVYFPFNKAKKLIRKIARRRVIKKTKNIFKYSKN